MTKNELAKEIYNTAHLTGQFLLRSGQTSNEYFDKYQFEAKPHLLASISNYLLPLLPDEFDYLGAMEMGGIPIATALSLQCGKEMIFIRKEAKSYGTSKFAEGPNFKGKTICLIEDVITTGGQVAISSNMLRDQGAVVKKVICVIDRSHGKTEKLTEAKLELKSLFTIADLKKHSRH